MQQPGLIATALPNVEEINLDLYFKRVQYSGERASSLKVLKELHYRHPLAIPFENLSSLLGHSVSLKIEDIHKKLVSDKRGGYCYEQNALFKNVLAALGFKVTGLAARVRWNIPQHISTPRSHMLLLVEVEDEKYICDVGFGGLTLTAPLKLQIDLIQQTPHEAYRIIQRDEVLGLEVLIKDEWKPVYLFTLEEQVAADYEVANWYISTHPESIFTSNLILARPTETGRFALRNNELTEHSLTGDTQKRQLNCLSELMDLLQNTFEIPLPQEKGVETSLAGLLKR